MKVKGIKRGQTIELSEELNLADGEEIILDISDQDMNLRENQLRPWGLGEEDFTLPNDFNAPLPAEILDLFEPK